MGKTLNRSVSDTCVLKTHRRVVSGKMPKVRRSLTITEENDIKVQNARSMFLALRRYPIDMDYTSMVNLLLEIGYKLFITDWHKEEKASVDSNEIIHSIVKHATDVALKEDAMGDQFQDWLIKNLPKMFEQYRQSQQTYVKVTSASIEK